MKRFKLIFSTLFLVFAICSTTSAGNITVTKAGNITVTKTGNITVTKAGNITTATSTEATNTDSLTPLVDQSSLGYLLLGILSVIL